MIEPPDFIYIDSNQTLADYCQQWQQQDVLALDTEFIRTRTFYPITGLLQIGDGQQSFLIDPLSIDDFTPLQHLLADATKTFVIHSCKEDLEVLQLSVKQLPAVIFDTQIAAAIAGLSPTMSYQRLVAALLNVELSKEKQRSDWLARPLEDEQLHYAAMDVVHLLEVKVHLEKLLSAQGRLEWAKQDCEDLLQQANQPEDLGNYYQKVKAAGQLRPRNLAALKLICEWREQTARTKDRPRGHIVNDTQCWDIARRMPRSRHQLAVIKNITPGIVHRYREALLGFIEQARELPEDDLPERLPGALPGPAKKIVKALRKALEDYCEEHNILTQVVLVKKDFEAIAWVRYETGCFTVPAWISGWRKDVLEQGVFPELENLTLE